MLAVGQFGNPNASLVSFDLTIPTLGLAALVRKRFLVGRWFCNVAYILFIERSIVDCHTDFSHCCVDSLCPAETVAAEVRQNVA
jgi:hypothetical protein